MGKDIAKKFLSWAWRQRDLTFTTRFLYHQYCLLSGTGGSEKDKMRFRGLMGRLSSRGLCVSLFRGNHVFPDAEIHAKLWDHPEAPWVILQDSLKNSGYVSNLGGFDVLYNDVSITVPPKASVLFYNGSSFFEVSKKLRRQSGKSISIQCYVVPRREAASPRGIRKKEIEGFPYRESDPYRAYEEAEWLVRSKYGIKTGLAGQKMLLDEAQEDLNMWELL